MHNHYDIYLHQESARQITRLYRKNFVAGMIVGTALTIIFPLYKAWKRCVYRAMDEQKELWNKEDSNKTA